MSRGSSTNNGNAPSMALFVGRLPLDARPRDLEDLFHKYGRITRCDVKVGYGFVEFEDKRDAEDALRALDGHYLLGRSIAVEFARGSRKANNQNKDSDSCFRCGDSGHWARDCSEPAQNRGGGRRRSPPRRRSRSPYRRGGRRGRSRSRSRDRYRRRRSRSRSRSRSRTPSRRERSRSRSHSPARSAGSPSRRKSGSNSRSRSRSRSPSPKRSRTSRSRSPSPKHSRSRSPSPKHSRSRSRSPSPNKRSHSRSTSPVPESERKSPQSDQGRGDDVQGGSDNQEEN